MKLNCISVLMVNDTLAEQGFWKSLVCCTVPQRFRGRILALILLYVLENSSTGCAYEKPGNLHEYCQTCLVQTINYYLNKCL